MQGIARQVCIQLKSPDGTVRCCLYTQPHMDFWTMAASVTDARLGALTEYDDLETVTMKLVPIGQEKEPLDGSSMQLFRESL